MGRRLVQGTDVTRLDNTMTFDKTDIIVLTYKWNFWYLF